MVEEKTRIAKEIYSINNDLDSASGEERGTLLLKRASLRKRQSIIFIDEATEARSKAQCDMQFLTNYSNYYTLDYFHDTDAKLSKVIDYNTNKILEHNKRISVIDIRYPS